MPENTPKPIEPWAGYASQSAAERGEQLKTKTDQLKALGAPGHAQALAAAVANYEAWRQAAQGETPDDGAHAAALNLHDNAGSWKP
jgi:hypothetical protein